MEKNAKTNSINVGPLSANHTKCTNTLKQFPGNFPTNCLSEFNYFLGLELKGLGHAFELLFSDKEKNFQKLITRNFFRLFL